MTDAGALLGASPGTFLGLTLLLFGAAALATGRALARRWRPAWQTLPYAVLLGLADRFLLYALFHGQVLGNEELVVSAPRAAVSLSSKRGCGAGLYLCCAITPNKKS